MLLPKERQDEERMILQRLRRGGGMEHYETVRLHKNGSQIDVSLSISPIRDKSGRIVGASKCARDITAQRRVDAALRDSEVLFRTFAMNAPVAIFIKDLQGRYTLANPLACKALGRSDGVTGMTDHDLLPCEFADRLRERDLEVISTGDAGERIEVVERDGFHGEFLSVKFPLLDADGRAVGVCGIATDVTERNRAQEALRESEERFVRFMRHLPGLAWIKNVSGEYVYANDAASKAFQTPIEQL
jgi:PAS domain S-box-containing protein